MQGCEGLESLPEILAYCQGRLEKIMAAEGEEEKVSRKISKVIAFIEEHYMEDISLELLADCVGYSPNYLSMVFKSQYGINLFEYLNKYRIEKAEELLLETNLYSYEIAVKTGFSDDSYFSKTFKKYTGHSPNEYRKKVRGKKK